MMKKFAKFVWILTFVGMCLCLTACGSTKVDMSPYLSVSYTGYNGNGTAHVDFDFAEFEYGIMSRWKGEDMMEKLGELTAVEMTIAYAADVSVGLRNGDVITVKISLNENLAKEYGYSFSGLETKFTVEGLNDPIMIDPFDENYFNTSVEGVSPFIRMQLNYTGSRTEPQAYITYQADRLHNLKNGDVVTISATMSEKYTQQGYLLTTNEIQVTVGGMESHITDVSALRGEDVSALKEKVSEYFDGRNGDWLDIHTVEGRNCRVYSEDVGFCGDLCILDYGYAVVQDGWGAASALVIPFRVNVKDVSFHWWNNEYYEVPLVKSFPDAAGYFVLTGLVLDGNGNLIKDGSYRLEMSEFYENEQMMKDAVVDRFGMESVLEGAFAG